MKLKGERMSGVARAGLCHNTLEGSSPPRPMCQYCCSLMIQKKGNGKSEKHRLIPVKL